MPTRTLYHGATGDAILSIIQSGTMAPRQGRVYFSHHRPESTFMHGADRKRGACFAIRVDVDVPPGVIQRQQFTHGVADAIIIETHAPLTVTVRELFIRPLGKPGQPEPMSRIPGVDEIRRYLGG